MRWLAQEFLRSKAGAVTLVGAIGAFALVGAVAVGVARTTAPPRRIEAPIDFAAMKVPVEELRFTASDGLGLRGLRLPGPPGASTIVLCHDLGANMGTMLELGFRLHAAGFDVVAFDFRGHGQSAGSRSTLGLEEKRDVIGAVDLALRGTAGAPRVGVFGVGMGAYAAILAARDRPAVRVLVLDGVYPDAGFRAARGALGDIGLAGGRLDVLPRGIFAVSQGGLDVADRASTAIAELSGRDLLLIAPAGDTGLALAMQRMYETLPDQVDSDGNLVLLPATYGSGLAGQQLARYNERVVEFFTSRLGD